ncbi:U19-ctenitoxin-Pn1a-like [Stegodyphus dumicola]|uniref:U19-ctenitoxin-Pn1a-like n=1 Tax=Stegodyphus dumicola TaxID=202533 RepID=UPI0015AFA52A|nr:U19-ctenitoxin-Pn1a-like [Stegodyphus dumicola]
MKYIFVLALLTCLVCTSIAQMPCPTECAEDECCTGGGYHRYCRKLGGEMDQCQPKNKYNDYRTACPCQEEYFCSVIGRCQKYE